jgi:acyl-CoA reductase-like NAD-dependent aldehyde dehydrogenase
VSEIYSKNTIPHALMYIDGQWVDSAERYEIRSPATEQVIATIAKGSIEHADLAVTSARRAFEAGVWRDLAPEKRAEVLLRTADQLAARSAELAKLASAENGFPMRIAEAGILDVAIDFLRYFARLGATYPYEKAGPSFGPLNSEGIIRREALEVCAAIVPWNVPLVLGMWKIAPALAAGNSVVVKPDQLAPLTLIELAREFERAGLPAGVLNVVTGEGTVVGAHLAQHPLVGKVAFTGSTATGREVMRLASSTVKRVTLELGGKAPSIVLEDADVDRAVDGVIYGCMAYSGQICESGTRVLLPHSLHDAFVAKLVERLKKLKIGDPSLPQTDLGPVISAAQRGRIFDFIEIAKSEGATLFYDGGRPEGPDFARGFWVAPTVFTEVTNDMQIAREEVFGPVLSVIRYDTVEDAIRIANDSQYGLSAGVWTRDRQAGLAVARRIQAGTVWINDWHALPPGYPFGGYKQSGVGREAGESALAQYTEEKFIAIAPMEGASTSPFAR